MSPLPRFVSEQSGISFFCGEKKFFLLGVFSVSRLDTYVPSPETYISRLGTCISRFGTQFIPRRKYFLSGDRKQILPLLSTITTTVFLLLYSHHNKNSPGKSLGCFAYEGAFLLFHYLIVDFQQVVLATGFLYYFLQVR